MAEGDIQCSYLTYVRNVLRNLYVAGNLLIYYEEGQPQTSVAPDVFVVFGKVY